LISLDKGTYTMKLDAGTQIIESGSFIVKPKFPLLLKALPVLVVGGLVAVLGGGKKDNKGSTDLPPAPDPN